MASAEKINSASAFAIGELNLASTVVIDSELDDTLRQKLKQSGVGIIQVEG